MDVEFRLHAVGADPAADRAHLDGMAGAYARVGYGALVPRLDDLAGVHLLTGWSGGRPVAGLRLHLLSLPTQRNFDDELVDAVIRVLRDSRGVVGEAAGTWVGDAGRGSRLSSALVAVAYAGCQALGMSAVVGSSPAEIISLYESVGCVYFTDHPKPDTPLPGVTGYFFYRLMTARPGWEEHAAAAAAQLRATGRVGAATLDALVDAVPAPARPVPA